ncbi:hypothetical protein ACU4IU_00360 [Brevibacterium sp. CSND-B09]|uniref:hypothetical protein n=1 Tax=Brevibacterium sp. CSND-B09 TaxID=3462571 RepID=UPI00406AA420
MKIKIVSIDSDGNEREIGTASRVDHERKTFPDPDAYQYPFILSTPKVYEERIVLQDFTGETDSSLYGHIYHELRGENARLKGQLELAKENFEHNVERVREENSELETEVEQLKATVNRQGYKIGGLKLKLANQQKNFEEMSAGQERAEKIRKDAKKTLDEAERKLAQAEQAPYLESLVDEQAAEIKALEKEISSLENSLESTVASRDYWIERTRDSDASYFGLKQKMRDALQEVA